VEAFLCSLCEATERHGVSEGRSWLLISLPTASEAMRRSLLVPLLALLTLAPLSGCLGSSHPATPATLGNGAPSSAPAAGSPTSSQKAQGTPPTGPHAPWRSVAFANGTLLASVNTPPFSATPTMRALGFDVKNATAVVLELAWDGPSALDLCLTRPTTTPFLTFGGCEDPTYAPTDVPSDGPHHLQVSYADPVEGKWSTHPTSATVAADVPYRLAVTVFHGGPVPNGYTAL